MDAKPYKIKKEDQMDPNSIIVNCGPSSSWIYTLIWGAVLPLFIAYVAAAAYAFQRRRSDIAATHEALREMRTLTMFALERVSGEKPDIRIIRETAISLVSRVRLEMLHRPEDIQKEMHGILEDLLKNADVAKGNTKDTTDTIVERMTSAENRLLHLLRQLTILDALRQAWSNSGIKVPFEPLIERFFKPSN